MYFPSSPLTVVAKWVPPQHRGKLKWQDFLYRSHYLLKRIRFWKSAIFWQPEIRPLGVLLLRPGEGSASKTAAFFREITRGAPSSKKRITAISVSANLDLTWFAPCASILVRDCVATGARADLGPSSARVQREVALLRICIDSELGRRWGRTGCG